MAAFEPQSLRETGLEGKDLEFHGHVAVSSFIMLSLLLFLALFLIYSLYICTYRWYRGVGQSTTHLSSGQAQSIMFCVGPGRGVDRSAINSLPIVSYGTGPNEGSMPNYKQQDVDCCICLDGFEEGEKVKVVPQCCHAFHSECLDEWLMTRSSCPLCRGTVSSRGTRLA